MDLGLVPLYKSDENVKRFCGMLDGLALCPLDDVTAVMNYKHPKENKLDGLQELNCRLF